jgi:hypothetical protein
MLLLNVCNDCAILSCSGIKNTSWVDISSGASALMLVESQYGSQITLPLRTSVAPFANAEVALAFHYTSDNAGAPSAEDVTEFWNSLVSNNPNAQIIASSLDDFVLDVLANVDLTALPTVTQELGELFVCHEDFGPAIIACIRHKW